MTTVDEYARHSAYSDPGAYAHLLDAVPTDIPALTDTVRNIIIHYRSGVAIPPERMPEIDTRWIDRILATDQARHPQPLDVPRDDTQKVAGCCRDYALLTVAILRQHGIAARSRVGFATYFFEGFRVDHVLAEIWEGNRWRFVDSQLAPGPMWPMDTHDVPLTVGEDPGEKPFFYTAAQAWTAYRRGAADPMTFGVHPELPHLCGAGFLAGEVFIELTHRMRDELLLWDLHGAVGDGPGVADPQFVDEIAGLMLRADHGDQAAEAELARRYAADGRMRPGETVRCLSPEGGDHDVNLRTRVAVPHQSSPDRQPS
jgi:Transglutaminase-like superfamily